MVKIRTRKETGNLIFDFQYQGVRCREQTDLSNTKENLMKLETVAKRIDAAITLGQFNYADYFRQSSMAAKFERRADHIKSLSSSGPTVAQFKEQWFNVRIRA